MHAGSIDFARKMKIVEKICCFFSRIWQLSARRATSGGTRNMNEATEKNINEAINWIQATSESVQDFATEQAPLYCREVVAWELWSGIALVSASVITLIIGLALLKKFWKATDNDEECILGSSIAFGIFILLPCIIVITHGARNSIKATVAPRVVIIEHLKDICK